MAAPVTHFEINVKDGKRAHEFYSNLFGWKVNAMTEMNYGMVDTGVKMGINGGIGQTDASGLSSAVFYVQVEDVQAYLDKAVTLGGKIILPLTDVPDMVTFAQFADFEGNVIGLVKGPQSPPKQAKPKKSPARKKKASKPKSRGRGKRKK